MTRRGFLVPVLATLTATACAPLTVGEGLILGPAGWTQARVTYGSDPRQSLSIHRPKDLRQPAPVVLLVSSATPTEADAVLARQIAEAGMVAVVAGRRSSPVAAFPAYIADNAKAVAWVVEQAEALGVGAHQIGVLGLNSGGRYALMLARDGRYFEAARLTGRVKAVAVAGLQTRSDATFTSPEAYVPDPSAPSLWTGEAFQILQAIQYLKQELNAGPST